MFVDLLCDDMNCHHSQCKISDSGEAFCHCDHGWSGEICNINICDGNPNCNHGHCDYDKGGCICNVGWEGDACNTRVEKTASISTTTVVPDDPCEKKNCSQGTFCLYCTGECVVINVYAQCVCEEDWAWDGCGKSDIVKKSL